ncbi:MAG: DoxX family protein [Rhizomicrobium sp.]|jgi:putative oxidoreductase
MSISERISPFIGRLFIAWFFLSEAWARLANFGATVAVLNAQHIPAAPALLVLALAAMFLGGISLVLGFHTRHGAMLLFGFTVVVSVLMHAFWMTGDGADRGPDYDIFVRNMAIAGGLLLLVGIGPGPFSLDNAGRKRK